MADIIGSVFEEVGPSKIIACCTDNAANMKKSWEILEERYIGLPITFYGCAAHILNLLFCDVMKFQSCIELNRRAVNIIKTIRRGAVLRARFCELQKEVAMGTESRRIAMSLKLPVATRWASVFYAFESLDKNKECLQRLAITKDLEENLGRENKAAILDDHFWNKLQVLMKVLLPIKKWINILQADGSLMSLTPQAFKNIQEVFNKTLPKLLKCDDRLSLQNSLIDRKDMCLKPIHFAANILDPRLKGKMKFLNEN